LPSEIAEEANAHVVRRAIIATTLQALRERDHVKPAFFRESRELNGSLSTFVMAGLVPPAGPKPLRRGEGPAIHVFGDGKKEDVDARDKPGHDEVGFPIYPCRARRCGL
jgi:hypothetical protein